MGDFWRRFKVSNYGPPFELKLKKAIEKGQKFVETPQKIKKRQEVQDRQDQRAAEGKKRRGRPPISEKGLKTKAEIKAEEVQKRQAERVAAGKKPLGRPPVYKK